MKLFLKNIFTFLTLPFLGFVLLFYLDYDREFAWNFIEGDCGGHGNWIYNRIYNNQKPIDVAFIGSSSIIAGINDEIVEDSFQRQTKLDLHFANLGYCRFGRNLGFVVLKDLLKNRKVKYVVLEVRRDEDRSSHPMFPYLSDSESVLRPAVFFNRDLFSDIYLAAVSRIEFLKQNIFYEKKVFKLDDNSFGHAGFANVADPILLEEIRLKRMKNLKRYENKFFRNLNMKYPRFYLDKINELCIEYDAELLFLYTPSFGYIDYLPKELDTYQKYGKVLVPPAAIFENKDHWADEVHINSNGSKLNSYWFVNIFAEYLQDQKD